MNDDVMINQRLADEFEAAKSELLIALKNLSYRTYMFGGIDEYDAAARRFEAAQQALRDFGARLKS